MKNQQSEGRLLRGASIAAAGMVFQQAISLISGLIVARVIGAADYGIFNLARNLIQLTSIATRMGLDLGLQRFIGAASSDDLKRWSSVLSQLRLLGLITSLLPCLVVGLGGGEFLEHHIYRYEGFASVLFYVCLSLPFLTDIAILGGAYRGIKNLAPSILAELVLLPSLRLAITLVLFSFGWKLHAAVAGSTGAAAMAAVYLAWRARSTFPVVAPESGSSVISRQVLGVSIVLAGSMAITTLTRSSDVLILGYYVSAAEIGQYTLAQMMLMVVALFGNALGQSLGATIAECHATGDTERMGELIRNHSRLVALATCPLYGIFIAWGHELALIFGPTFSLSQHMVGWLGAGVLLNAILSANGYALSMTGHHGKEFGLLALGLPLSAGLCLVAIPQWGPTGAAAATFFSLAGVGLLRQLRVQQLFGIRTLSRFVLPYAAATALLALGLDWMIDQLEVHRLIQVIVGMSAYLLIALLASWHIALRSDERQALRNIFSRMGLAREFR